MVSSDPITYVGSRFTAQKQPIDSGSIRTAYQIVLTFFMKFLINSSIPTVARAATMTCNANCTFILFYLRIGFLYHSVCNSPRGKINVLENYFYFHWRYLLHENWQIIIR